MADNGVCDRNMCKISPPTKLEKKNFRVSEVRFNLPRFNPRLKHLCVTFMHFKKVTKKISQNRLKISCVKSSENRLGNSDESPIISLGKWCGLSFGVCFFWIIQRIDRYGNVKAVLNLIETPCSQEEGMHVVKPNVSSPKEGKIPNNW